MLGGPPQPREPPGGGRRRDDAGCAWCGPTVCFAAPRRALHPDQARVLQEDLGLLAAAWNAYRAAASEDEPAPRDHLHEVLEGVLVELWENLPTRLTHGDEADG